MKKLKISPSIVILVIFCAIFNKFLLFLNYFVALAIHELAHFYIASKRGYCMKEFKIDLFGCSMELDGNVDDRDSFAVNIAGPCINLFLCLVCLALYYLFPTSYIYLNLFCISNLILALFNLLPIYPLDGGKIVSGIIKNRKVYKIVDISIRVIFSLIFLTLFIISLYSGPNYFYLIMIISFVCANNKRAPTFSIFKSKKPHTFEKVRLIKIDDFDNLYGAIKNIKKNVYTIFYYSNNQQYIDEDRLIQIALKYPLTTKIKDLKF